MANDNALKQLAIEAIKKKLLGKKLDYKEIFNLMDQISKKKISNVLTTYFVASSFKEGFSEDELYSLTKAMVETGKKIEFDGIVADKHSTGGVAGTRTTMIVVPIIAAAGFKIPKLSSRAITSPAGTADVMEVLAPVTFSTHRVMKIVNKVGGCIVWNGAMGIAPADDIIIKIEEPLAFESFDKVIVSIMAKKIAVSTNHLVLDIPYGKTMKIKHYTDVKKVEQKFKQLAKRFGISVVVDANETFEPAARGIGPALEARDVLYVLEQSANRPMPLEQKAIRLAGKLLDICYKDSNSDRDGVTEATRLLTSGQALTKFREIVREQGGDHTVSSDTFKIKAHTHKVIATDVGKVIAVNNFNINALAKILGAPDDKMAGLYLFKRIGEQIRKGEEVVHFYSSDKYKLEETIATLPHMPIYVIK